MPQTDFGSVFKSLNFIVSLYYTYEVHCLIHGKRMAESYNLFFSNSFICELYQMYTVGLNYLNHLPQIFIGENLYLRIFKANIDFLIAGPYIFIKYIYEKITERNIIKTPYFF